MYVLGFHLELPGAMRDLSLRDPHIEWSARPIRDRWLAESRSESGSRDAPPRTVIVPRSIPETKFLSDLEAWGATSVPPFLWRSGRVSVRLLTDRPTPPVAWRRRHSGAQLVVKRSVTRADLPRLLDGAPRWHLGLSERQREVLRTAVGDGYYDVPRRTTVARIARTVGIARSTAEEHLRVAESTLVRTIAPMTDAFAPETRSTLPADETWRTYARFSTDLELFVWLTLRGDRIARVNLERDHPAELAGTTHPYLDRIVGEIAQGNDDLRDLPVDLDVAPFDRKVLEEVRKVPPGRTASYREIAERIGRPAAARAVGNALARNPALIVLPCHRVVPSSGGVGSYSGTGGAETKRRLLALERARGDGSAP